MLSGFKTLRQPVTEKENTKQQEISEVYLFIYLCIVEFQVQVAKEQV